MTKILGIIIILLLVAAPNIGAVISELDAWDTTIAGAPSITVSAGTDRLFVVIYSAEVNNGERLDSLKLGTVKMMKIIHSMELDDVSAGVHNLAEAWYLFDTDIPGGTNTLFMFPRDEGGGNPQDTSFAFVTYAGVHQTTPINDTASDQNASAVTLNVTVSIASGGAAFFSANQKSNGTGVWTGPTEQFDIDPGNNYHFSGADSVNTASGTLNGAVTVTKSAGRMVIFGVALAQSGVAPPAAIGRRRKIVQEESR